MLQCPTCNGRFSSGQYCPKDGTALAEDHTGTTDRAGELIGGRYRLTERLGEGGMGEVYAGEHIHITKRVAVKLLHRALSESAEAVARFRQEAQSASSIGHENIVTIDDFGVLEDGRVYLCMELLEGDNLGDLMKKTEDIDTESMLDLMQQVCLGLQAAHEKGIVHRDLKPENIFVTRRADGSELVKVLDFGIAKVLGVESKDNLTKTGTVFGTPHYMSPEQAMGQKIDHRSDVYSMGVILFEIATGHVPFRAETFMGILSQHITKPPPRPSDVAGDKRIPEGLEPIILKAMEKKVEDRFQSIVELEGAIARINTRMREPEAQVSQAATAKTVLAGSEAASAISNANKAAVASSTKTMDPGGLTTIETSSLYQRRRGWLWPSVAAFSILAGGLLIWAIQRAPAEKDNVSANLDSNASTEVAQPRDTQTPPKTEPEPIATDTPEEKPSSVKSADKSNEPKSKKTRAPRRHNQKWQPQKPVKQLASQKRPSTETAEPTAPTPPTETTKTPATQVATAPPKPTKKPSPANEETPHKPLPTTTNKEAAAAETNGTILLSSEPTGASVWQNGKRIGRTPLKITLDSNGAQKLRLALRGYSDKSVSLRPDSGTKSKTIKLERRQFGLP